jgi:acyl-coenzyme A synthetase/AMP-(fatty) acid ligase
LLLTVARLGGTTYTDALHVYGITRAGYIPQLFSLRLPNPTIIYELLQQANAKVLIYDQAYERILIDSPVPTLVAVNAKNSGDIDELLPDFPVASSGEDMVFLFHTSGSTSGTPKLVPWTYSFVHNTVENSTQYLALNDHGKQIVSSWFGSVCHAGQHIGT